MALFENYDRRIAKINGVLAEYGIGTKPIRCSKSTILP